MNEENIFFYRNDDGDNDIENKTKILAFFFKGKNLSVS